MNEDIKLKLSKSLSYFLRHRPEEIKLDMDSRGYVLIEQYIQQFNQQPDKKRHILLTKKMLLEIVKEDSQRYSISEDGLYIRANYGHSITNIWPDLELLDEPPKFLLHGTALHNKESILEKGLQRMNRNAVHLTDDKNEAMRVGKRHCHDNEPILLLTIQTERASNEGHKVYKTQNGKYLMDEVKPEYIVSYSVVS